MNAVRVAERLDRSRFRLSVACFSDAMALRTRFIEAGVPIDVFPIGKLYGTTMLQSGRAFMRFLRRERVDVVHAHDRYANMFAVPWARLAGVPRVIASKRWGTTSRAHGIGNRAAYRMAHAVLGNSGTVGRSLVEEDGVPPSRVVVIPNFVDEAAFDDSPPGWDARLREELAIPEGALVVGIVASLRTIKDHGTLLRAVARLRAQFPQLVLVMMGWGAARPDLEALVVQLGIGNMVRFAGIHPNLPNPHRLFDVSVLCSLSEGFPNTIVEAMAAGRPVVATNVGGVPDAVVDGVNGLLVPARDDEALAGALAKFLADPSLRQTMGSAGQAMARSQFTAEHVLPLVESLYENGLG